MFPRLSIRIMTEGSLLCLSGSKSAHESARFMAEMGLEAGLIWLGLRVYVSLGP